MILLTLLVATAVAIIQLRDLFAATFFLPFYGVGETDPLAFGLVLHGTFLLPPIAIAVATLLIVGGPWPSRREVDARASE